MMPTEQPLRLPIPWKKSLRPSFHVLLYVLFRTICVPSAVLNQAEARARRFWRENICSGDLLSYKFKHINNTQYNSAKNSSETRKKFGKLVR